MKHEIKVGDTTFEFNYPEVLDKSTTDMMNDWCRLVEQQKNNEDIWTTIPELPQFKFKNLKIETSPFETSENASMDITFHYDEFVLNEQ